MSSSAFALGVHDVRAGLPLRDIHSQFVSQWAYERGRAWAVVAPRTMPLFVNGKLNPEARKIAKDAILW
jgi:hypothetical protein